MKKVIMAFALVLISALCFAGNQQTKASKDSTNSGQVVVMDKNMFINDVFDYQNTPDWKYKGKLPAIIDLYADWCGPCRMVSPIIDEIATERGDLKVGKVNVDEQPELAAKFGVMSIPTLIVMKDGKVVNQTAGARPKPQILSLIP